MTSKIPKYDLKPNTFYIGEGRCIAGIAMWTGWNFVGIGVSFNIYEVSHMEYGDKGFSPYKEVQS